MQEDIEETPITYEDIRVNEDHLAYPEEFGPINDFIVEQINAMILSDNLRIRRLHNIRFSIVTNIHRVSVENILQTLHSIRFMTNEERELLFFNNNVSYHRTHIPRNTLIERYNQYIMKFILYNNTGLITNVIFYDTITTMISSSRIRYTTDTTSCTVL
jgi:hypothetical protein